MKAKINSEIYDKFWKVLLKKTFYKRYNYTNNFSNRFSSYSFPDLSKKYQKWKFLKLEKKQSEKVFFLNYGKTLKFSFLAHFELEFSQGVGF